MERLAAHLALPDTVSLFDLHARGIDEQIARGSPVRQPHWTESLAVGSEAFVTVAASCYRQRRQLLRHPIAPEFGTDTWAVRELSPNYNADSRVKSNL